MKGREYLAIQLDDHGVEKVIDGCNASSVDVAEDLLEYALMIPNTGLYVRFGADG